jgi:LmbE family N-acetylglucosaminyl deacetylase
MDSFFQNILAGWNERPFAWLDSQRSKNARPVIPKSGKALVLAPHPDDPESVVVTTRMMMKAGCSLQYCVATLSPAGVEDAFAEKALRDGNDTLKSIKENMRRDEQLEAAKLFGLTADRVDFLGLNEACLDSPKNEEILEKYLDQADLNIALLPCGNDSNRTHRWVFQAFRKWALFTAQLRRRPILALYNEDPKTIEMRTDLLVFFGQKTCEWKKQLLLAHASQQQRNINSTGIGFDHRILSINERCAKNNKGSLQKEGRAHPNMEFAENFEMEMFLPH